MAEEIRTLPISRTTADLFRRARQGIGQDQPDERRRPRSIPMHKNVARLMILLVMAWFMLLATACGPAPAESVPASSTDAASATPAPADSIELGWRGTLERPSSDAFEEMAGVLLEATDTADRTFLGLTVEDWINLGLSVLVVLVSILLLIPLLINLLALVIGRTKTSLDDHLLLTIGRELKWLVAILVVRWAVLRLDFLSERLWVNFYDIFFLLVLGVLYILAVRLISFAANRYRGLTKEGEELFAPNIELFRRLGYLFVSLLAVGIAFSHFGGSMTMTVAAMMAIIIIIAIAARQIIDDVISGLLILMDKPFQVGDYIHLVGPDVKGKVVKIGYRYTRIRSLDNHEFMIINSQLGSGINYNTPDPSVRVDSVLTLAYGTDPGLAERVIQDAVRSVEDVLPDKPVEVWFSSWNVFNREMRVLWWIADITRADPIRNRVNAAIEHAMAEAGIQVDFPTYNLHMTAQDEAPE